MSSLCIFTNKIVLSCSQEIYVLLLSLRPFVPFYCFLSFKLENVFKDANFFPNNCLNYRDYFRKEKNLKGGRICHPGIK